MKRKSHGPAKLPSKQLAILAICRFAEPVALTSVYPYLPEMIESLGIKEKQVAKWAGITSAAFSLSQCTTAIIWGRASDMFGRKPTILFGLTCTMICTLLWGMSTSLPMAIIVRALAGACNGNVGIIRTMVAEMVPEKELQPRAFSIMPLVWSLGSIFGPSFGGFFAKPAENMPGLFGSSKFLIKFPFLLPNIVASALFMVGISTGILFLKETLETKRHRTDYGREVGARLVSAFKTIFRLNRKHKTFRRNSTVNEEQSLLRPTSSAGNGSSEQYDRDFSSKSIPKPPQPAPALREVFTRQSVINLIAYTLLALHSVAYDQLLPIFMHAKKQPHDANTQLPFKFTGGFGINHARIGVLFTAYGFVGCFIQFLVFPPTARRFGVLNCFKGCAVAFPLVCFVTPYTALIQSSALQQAAMFGIMVVKSFAVIFAFPCSIILLTNSAVSLRILGTLNGVAVSVSAVGRAIGPALGGSAFTWGVERGYVITPWWLLGIIAMIGAIPIWHLVEMEGFSKSSEDSDDDDEDEEELLDQVDEEGSDVDILDGDEVFDEFEEALDVVDGPPITRVTSKKSLAMGSDAGRSTASGTSAFERRLSSPIGLRESVGPGGGRRLSNGLAASNLGQGTGGRVLLECFRCAELGS
ncbi:putative membrane protein [Lachnellula arida]|uniref:Putative membrane protein n=1 Tax=Lachnellula arida TaxID=1316785 RepID=A0A8T9B1G1_9HELO|nr:putative membrane protein [Lachnellula arida]